MKLSLLQLSTIIAVASAQSCTQQAYYTNPGWPRSDGCVPTNYNAASDLGQISTFADAQTRCNNACTNLGPAACGGYVAQLNKAGDSNLYTGTCFLFASGTIPSSPRECVDKPTILLSGIQDRSLQCFSSSLAVATPFCSSYLSIGTVTKYTATSTPVSTVYKSKTITKTSITISTTSKTSTITTISTSTATTSVTSTYLTTTTQAPARRLRRAASQPSCVAAGVPASQLSAACSCLNIPSPTLSTLSVAPTRTTTLTSTSTTSTTTSTTKTLSFLATTTTSTTATSTAVSTTTRSVTACTTAPGTLVTNGGFNEGSTSPFFSGGIPIRLSTQSQCGAYAAVIYNQDQASMAIIQDQSKAVIGNTYRIGFWMALPVGKSGAGCTIYSIYGYAQESSRIYVDLTSLTTTYQYFTFTHKVTRDGTYVGFQLSCSAASGGQEYLIDEITVVPA